jgi:hypothetical protein
MTKENLMFTHQKRPYKALAIQWNGSNAEEVASLLKVEFRWYNDHLMLKHENGDFSTLKQSDWIVRGENGEVKTYTDYTFITKYTEVWINE